MYTGYGYFNNGEVWNNQRVVAYLKGDPFNGVPGLAPPSTVVSANCGCDALSLYCEQGSGEGGAFVSPRLDEAPWYDPDVPDSEQFAGLFVTEITGFDSTLRRSFTEGAISGGSLGPARLSGRCMTVTGWLMAQTCCGAEYGLRWLQEALMGNNFCDDCGYSDLYMIKCCPPDEDSCYTSEVSVTDTVPDVNVWFTVTDTGGGSYTIEIDDSQQANLISDPAGALNNTDGPIPTCEGAGYSFRFVLTDALGAVFTFFIPAEAITSFVTSPSGLGASATFVVDTTVVGSCDDVVRDIQKFTTQVTEYLSVYDSGELVATTTPTQVRCFETVEGFNPDDYVRLLHRVGLTDGPKVIERRGTCCSNDCGCVNIKVQFTLCSEFPHIFSDIDWCIEDQPFDLENCYCLDLRKLCNVCSTQDATKTVEVEVARKSCGIDIYHDGSWCPAGWEIAEEGCPPTDCYLDINEAVAYDPEASTECTGSATDDTPCVIGLYDDKTWTPLNFDMADGFPPKFCDLVVLFGGTCDDENPNNCLIRVIYDENTGTKTWEPIRWSGDLPAFPECDCVEIAEVCVIAAGETCPDDPSECPINVICDVEYRPDQCTTRQAMCAFFYRLNGSPAFVPPVTPTFSDVGINNEFYLEIEWAYAQGLVDGYGDGTFRPENDLSRQAAAAFFYRDAGSPAFTPPTNPSFIDVGTAHPFYTEIEWCRYEGIFFGFDDGSFRPEECLTRRSAALTIYRYEDIKPTFSDVAPTDTFFNEIEWSKDQGIFYGYNDGTFRPGDDVLRRVAALAFYRDAGEPAFVPPGVPTFLDVPLTDPQYLEIEWAYAQNIFDGFPGPNFQPDTALSRQAAAAAFYRYNGSPAFVPPGVPTFTDVPLIHPFYLEIEWCYDQGIATGFPDGSFQPAAATTRQVLATFFYRNAGSPPYSPTIYTPTLPPYFADVPETDVRFQEIEWMADQGITFGFTNSRSWEPVGWELDPDAAFPPENCNIYIATVNGAEQDFSPVKQLIEVPWDEFVPDCGPFPVQPPPTTVFTAGECYCEPWEQARECCTFTNPADWSEATSYVEVWTGSEEMRNLKIEAYRNPFGEKVPCPCDPEDEFWECRDPCATILVPQLPARAKLIIDSRQRIAQLVLSSGRTVNALRYIFSGDGKPFEWFDIGQCSTFCIIAQADCRQTAEDATISIGAVGRFTASGW